MHCVCAGLHRHRAALHGDAARVAGGLGARARGRPAPGLQPGLLAQVQVRPGESCKQSEEPSHDRGNLGAYLPANHAAGPSCLWQLFESWITLLPLMLCCAHSNCDCRLSC